MEQSKCSRAVFLHFLWIGLDSILDEPNICPCANRFKAMMIIGRVIVMSNIGNRSYCILDVCSLLWSVHPLSPGPDVRFIQNVDSDLTLLSTCSPRTATPSASTWRTTASPRCCGRAWAPTGCWWSGTTRPPRPWSWPPCTGPC